LAQVLVSVNQISYGLCIPSSCTEGDVFINNKILLSSLNLQTEILNSITEEDTKNNDLPTKTIAFA
jgi:hypothetical protein